MGSHGVSRGFTGVYTGNYAEPVTLLGLRCKVRGRSPGGHKVAIRLHEPRDAVVEHRVRLGHAPAPDERIRQLAVVARVVESFEGAVGLHESGVVVEHSVSRRPERRWRH